MSLTVLVLSDEAFDERHAKQKQPSLRLPLPSLPGEQRNGQSTAHTKEELAYFLAQNHSLNCSCIESVFSTPPLCSLSPSLCFSPYHQPLFLTAVFLSFFFYCYSFTFHFVPPIIQSSSDDNCASSLGGWGGGHGRRKTGAENVFGMLHYRNRVVSLK